MNSPKSNPSNLLQCLIHFYSKQKFRRMCDEKKDGKQGQGGADPRPFTQQFYP